MPPSVNSAIVDKIPMLILRLNLRVSFALVLVDPGFAGSRGSVKSLGWSGSAQVDICLVGLLSQADISWHMPDLHKGLCV